MATLGSESAPLFGRFNAGIHRLEALGYEEVAAFYKGSPLYGLTEKLLMYGILGGTPRYHALVDTTRPLDEEVIALLMQPRAALENEVRFLLSSEHIRDPAPYNAALGAIAAGETQFGRIQQHTGVERGTLSFYLKTLQELGWVRRELPFGDTTDKRALYGIADPFLDVLVPLRRAACEYPAIRRCAAGVCGAGGPTPCGLYGLARFRGYLRAVGCGGTGRSDWGFCCGS